MTDTMADSPLDVARSWVDDAEDRFMAHEEAQELEETLPRRVDMLRLNIGFCHNGTKSSRFTTLNFIPLALVEQLHPLDKFVNVYFLAAGALQLVSAITLTKGMPMIWLNVGILFIQDMITMAVDDAAKHRADRTTNQQRAQVLSANGTDFQEAAWADVRVGDVVRVGDRQAFPADLMLLRASDPEPGQCWVNTKPIDGETDIKLRVAPRATVEALSGAGERSGAEASEIQRVLSGYVLTEAPNEKVNDFTGQLFLDGAKPQLLDRQILLLRGCQLRSTDWILGLVMYTGRDTKANYGGEFTTKMKRANTLRLLNRDLSIIIAILMLVCTAGATANSLLVDYSAGAERWWYLPADALDGATEWSRHLGIYFLLEYMFMPTTLFVTMPLIQILTCLFISWDLGMYDAEQVEKPLPDKAQPTTPFSTGKKATLPDKEQPTTSSFSTGCALRSAHAQLVRRARSSISHILRHTTVCTLVHPPCESHP